MTKRIRLVLLLAFSIIVCLAINTGCSKGVNSEKDIANEDIYPIGDLESAKIIDKLNNEKEISLNQTDIEYIVKVVKESDKELVTTYDSAVELNISLSDSKVQLIRQDDGTVYYVFHNSEINAVTFKVSSEELSEWIFKLIEEDHIEFGKPAEINNNESEISSDGNQDELEKIVFDVPDYILSEVSSFVEKKYVFCCSDFPECEYSDWRIEDLVWVYQYEDLNGLILDIYRVNYEFHTEKPEKVVLAGGMYITEDNWVCVSYPDCTYFVFDTGNESIKSELMCVLMENDCYPGDELFTSDLLRKLSDIEK